MLKKILLGLVGLIAVAVLGSFAMPSKWNVERSLTMKAAPETIYTYVADLNQWDAWTVWNSKADPEMKREVSGTAMGAGATMKWTGPKMGNGTMTLTKGDPATGVTYELTFEGMPPATGVLAFAADGAGTKVTWTNSGDVGMSPMGRWMNGTGMMEKMMGPDFEKNLENLKTMAEKAQMDKDAAAAAAAAAAAPPPAEGAAAPADPAKVAAPAAP